LHAFSKELEAAMRQSSGNTVAALRKAIMKAEEGKAPKSPLNQMQVYFPQNRGPVQGYRALSESTVSFSLTLAKLREAQISSPKHKITIKNISILTLYPTLIDATLSITGSAPTLRSTIPGRARHAIREIEIRDASLSQFINAQRSFFSEKLGVNKTFFIRKLTCQDGVFENVVVLCEAKKFPKIFYKKNNKHYLVSELTKAVTPFRYAIEVSSAYRLTEPSSQALRLATAGQESVEALNATWAAHPFEGDFSPCNPDRLPKMTAVQANSILRVLSSDNKGQFLYHLLTHGRGDLAEKLVKKGTIPLDTVSPSGDTLLHLAIKSQSTTLFDYLLTQKIDCNAQGADGNTPLHLALKAGNPEFAKKLLETSHIIMTTINNKGNLPIYYGDCTPEVWAILLKKISDRSILSTIVRDYCKRPSPPMASIETLLNAGANPNLATPTAFEEAFKSGNIALTALLLKFGANPFEANAQKRIPFNELLQCAPRSALIRFINLPETKIELRKNLDNFNTMLATAHTRSDPMITDQLMKVIDIAAFTAENFNAQLERKNYVLCAYLIMAGFKSISKDAAGKIPLINFLEKASFSLSKDFILGIFDSMNVDWNLEDSEGKKLYQLVLSAIRSHRVETYCILLRKGMQLDTKTLHNEKEMIIYIKNIEILKALIETHGPLTPEATRIGCKILIDSFLYNYDKGSFESIQTYVDRGFFNWSLEIGGGDTVGSLITNDIICHKPFETDDFDDIQAHLEKCNKRVTQMVAFCFQRGVDPNWTRTPAEGDIQAKSFIEMAIRDQNKPLVDLLIESGLKKEIFEQALETFKDSPALLEWIKDQKLAGL
jgi:ankyrin repeat protein